MAKKLKDWYDTDYLFNISQKIQKVHPDFDSDLFYRLTEYEINQLEFGQRQELIAKALKDSIKLDYEKSIEAFSLILGPELPNNEGNFSKGYWLWPMGKFVELYGTENLKVSLAFSKELTKRFTSEYCMRPLIANNPEQVMPLLVEWSQDENMRVRRLSSECVRLRLPWAKKMTTALNYFNEYYQILSNLRYDSDKYIQKSVANNLNDLSKESPKYFYQIINQWEKEQLTKETTWIIKHASRNLEGK
ncbi:DNA alkylation repair protein [Mammaliicoccus sciuri]|uniref:DNA alkylation repair protein n=1 Tax=Mammaliicoccus sciuri TaxID=1296 RepID=UPI003AE43C78